MSTEATPGSPGMTPNTDPHQPQPAGAGEAPSRPSAFAGTTSDERRAEHMEAAAAAAAAAGPAPPTHHDDLIAALRRELSDLKDKNLRLLADMENLRRRTDEEKNQFRAVRDYAVCYRHRQRRR